MFSGEIFTSFNPLPWFTQRVVSAKSYIVQSKVTFEYLHFASANKNTVIKKIEFFESIKTFSHYILKIDVL